MTLPDYVCYMYPEFLKCSEKNRFFYFLGGILDNFGHFRKFGKLQISKKKANNDVERGILHICIITSSKEKANY